MELKANTSAFFDTFAGLVPCKVLKVTGDSPWATSAVDVTFRITKNHGPYKKDEQITSSSLWVCPTEAIRTRGGVRFIGPYSLVKSG